MVKRVLPWAPRFGSPSPNSLTSTSLSQGAAACAELAVSCFRCPRACALAIGLAVGCQPGEVGETDAGAHRRGRHHRRRKHVRERRQRGGAGTGGSSDGHRRDVGQRGLERRLRRRVRARRRGRRSRRDRHRGHRRRQRQRGRGGTTGTAGTGGAAGSRRNDRHRGTGGAAGRGGTTAAPQARAARRAPRGASGTTGSGGSPPTQCTLQNHSGNGSFTWYYFGRAPRATATATAPPAATTAPRTAPTDTIENIASMSPASATYFAAIPGPERLRFEEPLRRVRPDHRPERHRHHRDRHRRMPLRQRRRQQRVRRQRRRPPGSEQDRRSIASATRSATRATPTGSSSPARSAATSRSVSSLATTTNSSSRTSSRRSRRSRVNGTGASRQSYGAWHVGSGDHDARDVEPDRHGGPIDHGDAEQRHQQPGYRHASFPPACKAIAPSIRVSVLVDFNHPKEMRVMSRKLTALIVGLFASLALAAGTMQGCGSSSSSGDNVALCQQACDKALACTPDAGSIGQQATTQCKTELRDAGRRARTARTRRRSPARSNACLPMACDAYLHAARRPIPDCQSTTGTGGTTGAAAPPATAAPAAAAAATARSARRPTPAARRSRAASGQLRAHLKTMLRFGRQLTRSRRTSARARSVLDAQRPRRQLRRRPSACQ